MTSPEVTSILTQIAPIDLIIMNDFGTHTAQKMKFSIKNFFSKCDQIRWKLRIWSNFTEEILNGKLHFFVQCQCNIEPLNYDDNDEDSQTEYGSRDSDESEYHQKENKYDNDSSSDTPITDSGKMPWKTAFVVYWSSLMILLKSCLTFSLLATVKDVTIKGSQLIVALTCPNNHENIWKSQ